ncbi:hypothetical protein [Pedobacter sandarakinus]|uniref:hypothetical protein n=1 Tax=Pedobacter sandarakinus TaxID=353156 RepID=UPI002245EEC7|nr:hypothetical protein [Pedobacter sandarakinus]MCX2576154.1 hypothetical protein [Pedobacter sandarakinus]
MKKPNTKDANLPVEGQDFANPDELKSHPSSHGEVANQKGGDFSDLEKTRMEHPPEERDTNGSSESDVDTPKNDQEQSKGTS